MCVRASDGVEADAEARRIGEAVAALEAGSTADVAVDAELPIVEEHASERLSLVGDSIVQRRIVLGQHGTIVVHGPRRVGVVRQGIQVHRQRRRHTRIRIRHHRGRCSRLCVGRDRGAGITAGRGKYQQRQRGEAGGDGQGGLQDGFGGLDTISTAAIP